METAVAKKTISTYSNGLKAVIENSPEVATRHRIITVNHAENILARQVAKRIVTILRMMDMRQEAKCQTFVFKWLKKYGVERNQWEFAFKLVNETINKDN